MQQKSINLSWSKGCLFTRTLRGDAVLFLVCTHVHRIGFQHCYLCSAPFPPRDWICPSGKASNLKGFTFLSFFLLPSGGAQTPQGAKVMTFAVKPFISSTSKHGVLLSDVWELSQWLVACSVLSGGSKADADSEAHVTHCLSSSSQASWLLSVRHISSLSVRLATISQSLHWKAPECCASAIRRRNQVVLFPQIAAFSTSWWNPRVGAAWTPQVPQRAAAEEHYSRSSLSIRSHVQWRWSPIYICSISTQLNSPVSWEILLPQSTPLCSPKPLPRGCPSSGKQAAWWKFTKPDLPSIPSENPPWQWDLEMHRQQEGIWHSLTAASHTKCCHLIAVCFPGCLLYAPVMSHWVLGFKSSGTGTFCCWRGCNRALIPTKGSMCCSMCNDV